MPATHQPFADPLKSLELLDALGASGFNDQAFAVIHHHKVPMTIEAHRRYCAMLSEDGDIFKTTNNRLIQKRLEMILTMYRSAGFTGEQNSVFIHLANAALAEVPHDLRPIAEQHAETNE